MCSYFHFFANAGLPIINRQPSIYCIVSSISLPSSNLSNRIRKPSPLCRSFVGADSGNVMLSHMHGGSGGGFATIIGAGIPKSFARRPIAAIITPSSFWSFDTRSANSPISESRRLLYQCVDIFIFLHDNSSVIIIAFELLGHMFHHEKVIHALSHNLDSLRKAYQ